MTLEPVGPQLAQKETVVVEVTVSVCWTVVVASAEELVIGRVRVTVVGVAAHWVQTVTVVVHPSGTEAVVVTAPAGGLVTVAEAVAVAVASGQT